MAQKDGEASVEDILRSIKQVISREDGPRRSPDTFARDTARENGEPLPERPASFSPYSFQRHSPFGARAPEGPAPEPEAEEDAFDDARSDVFDLRSLDSDAFVDDDDVTEESAPSHVDDSAAHEDEPIIMPPPDPETGTPQWSAVERDEVPDNSEPASKGDPDTQDRDVEAISPEYGDSPDEAEQPLDEGVEGVATVPAQRVQSEPPTSEPASAAENRHADASEGLIAGAAAEALRARFSALEQAAHGGNDAASGKTAPNPLEDMVRDMLRPMLKQWLDDNMPGLVEKIVEREIARITGRL